MPMNSSSKEGLVYKCSCGKMSESQASMMGHLGKMKSIKQEGHVYQGQVDVETGEVVIPPWPDKSTPPKITSQIATDNNPDEIATDNNPDLLPAFNTPGEIKPKNRGGRPPKNPQEKKIQQARATDIINEATELKFIPKVFTIPFTPTMQQALHIFYNVLKWPKEWPIEDVLDTALWKYLYEHGIEIGVYKIDEKVLAQLQGNGEKEPEEVTA